MLKREDELAVHTVASAAYRILRDLLEKRGFDDEHDLIQHGVLGLAEALSVGSLGTGDLQKMFHDDTVTTELIVDLAGRMSRGEEVTAESVVLQDSADAKRRRLNARSLAANFLKHADRDSAAALSLSEIDNADTIMRAVAAYLEAARSLTSEMQVFYLWWAVDRGDRLMMKPPIDSLVNSLAGLSAARRRQACLKLIRKRWTYL